MSTSASPVALTESVVGRLSGRQAILGALVAAWGLTLAGVLAVLVEPSLAIGGTPRPTMHGEPVEVARLIASNGQLFAVPWVLILCGLGTGPTRFLGDVVVAGLLIPSTVLVGLALGEHGTELVPYLPHLPFEWGALALSVAVWLYHRDRKASAGSLLAFAVPTVVLLVAAAAIEAFGVPRAA